MYILHQSCSLLEKDQLFLKVYVSVCVCVCVCVSTFYQALHSAKFLIYYALIEVADTIHPPEISPVCIAIATLVNNWALNRV